MKLTLVRLSTVFLVIVLLAACAAQLLNLSKVQFVSPNFTSATLLEGGLAILPVTAGGEQEGFRRPVGEKLGFYIKQDYPELNSLGFEDSLSRLNDAGMTKPYSDMLIAYINTAIVDKSVLNEMGKVLKTRYALQTRLLKQNESSSLKRGVLVSGVYQSVSRDVEIFGQVWDLVKGDVVWEGYGIAKVESGEMTYVNTDIDTIVDEACKGLARNLLRIPIK
jgi:hypothetical protein